MAFVKNRVQPKDCGKVKYPSEDAAVHATLTRRFGAGMSAYYHGPCQAWHVGHTPGTGRKRRG